MKKIAIIFVFFILGFSLLSQNKENPYKTKKNEPYQFFKFKKFNRHFSLQKINGNLDSLNLIKQSNWTLEDSIFLFSNLARIKNYDDAYKIVKLIRLNRFKINNYSIAKDLIYTFKNKFRPDLSLQIIDSCIRNKFIDSLTFKWLKNIHEARQNKLIDWKYLMNHNILKFPVDTVLPIRKIKNQFYIDSIIKPLQKLNQILKDEVLYTPKNDPIIAEIFYEIGNYLERVGSKTQAYIAYNLGKLYNSNDFKIPKRLRIVKDYLIKKNYRIPGIRTLFPKYKKSRFNFKILKARIKKQEYFDSIPKKKLPKMKLIDKNDFIQPISSELLLFIGLVAIFIFVLVFVKTK